MCTSFAFVLIAHSLLSYPLTIQVSSVFHPMPTITGVDPAWDSTDLLPWIVRKRFEEVAGNAPVHHQGKVHHHGIMVFTGRFNDPQSGVEQIITVAPDGRLMYIEPFLLTAVRRK